MLLVRVVVLNHPALYIICTNKTEYEDLPVSHGAGSNLG